MVIVRLVSVFRGMIHDKSRTHIKYNKQPSLATSSFNSPLRPWPFNRNLLLVKSDPQDKVSCQAISNVHIVPKEALRISGPGETCFMPAFIDVTSK